MFGKKAFSLVEVLVVLAIIFLLTTILVPSLARARREVYSVVCRSNLRQLYFANVGYAGENNDFYVPAASDLHSGFGGKRRWHGVRKADSVHPDPNMNTFNPRKGPLVAYLADGKVKQCPEIVDFVKQGSKNAFESGCGGYGYNSIGVGSRTFRMGSSAKAMRLGMKTTEITNAGAKVMFTDTALLQGFFDLYLIEYSFCEPPFDISGFTTKPSIHFRHLEKTNVVWCDGHVSGEKFAFSILSSQVLDEFKIGWFGPEDNRLFRP